MNGDAPKIPGANTGHATEQATPGDPKSSASDKGNDATPDRSAGPPGLAGGKPEQAVKKDDDAGKADDSHEIIAVQPRSRIGGNRNRVKAIGRGAARPPPPPPPSGGKQAERIQKRKEAAALKKAKLNRLKLIISGVVLFFSLIIWYGLQPIRGTIHVGICRTYIEMQIPYPISMQLTDVSWFQQALRMYYTHTGPFGQTRSDMAECIFNADLTLSEVSINRQPISPARLQAFNATIPAIIQNNPDLLLPQSGRNDLASLKRD